MLEKQGPIQFGLMKSFSSPALFQLDLDSLAEIRSPDAFMEYLGSVSDGSRLLLPKSMAYMYEEVLLPATFFLGVSTSLFTE